MTSTLTPTCPVCGLRFENRPILELHIREDHPQHSASAEPGHALPAAAPASQPPPRGPRGERAAASRTKTEATVTCPRRPRLGRARAGLRRVIGTFRHANAELMLASELMLRPVGPPRPRQPADPPAERDGHQAAADERTDRAA